MKRVFVDADSCAARARKYLLSRAKKNKLELFLAANRDVLLGENPNTTMVVVPAQSQAADQWILQNAQEGDIAVTRDIPLAADLLEKKVAVLDDRGRIFDKKNIERALKERALSIQMQELGIGTKRRSCYGQDEFLLFAKSFDKLLAE